MLEAAALAVQKLLGSFVTTLMCSSFPSTGHWRKTIRKNIRIEKWDATVLDIRTTMDKLEDNCGQLPGMHALSSCDTVSYPYGQGKKSALKVLMNNDIDGLVGGFVYRNR